MVFAENQIHSFPSESSSMFEHVFFSFWPNSKLCSSIICVVMDYWPMGFIRETSYAFSSQVFLGYRLTADRIPSKFFIGEDILDWIDCPHPFFCRTGWWKRALLKSTWAWEARNGQPRRDWTSFFIFFDHFFSAFAYSDSKSRLESFWISVQNATMKVYSVIVSACFRIRIANCSGLIDPLKQYPCISSQDWPFR